MTGVDLLVLFLGVTVVLSLLAGVAYLVARRRRRARAGGSGAPTSTAPSPRTAAAPVPRTIDLGQLPATTPTRPSSLPPLPEPDRQRYLSAWQDVQVRFLSSPVLALSQADALLTALLAERGLPCDGLRTRADLPHAAGTLVLEDFRAGRAIEQANSTRRADLDEVRKGMVHFQAVLEELVGDAGPAYPTEPPSGTPDHAPVRDRPTPR